MINSIRLNNFRNFEDKIINLKENNNFIVWENWKWKTNLLEAISILCLDDISNIKLENLVRIWNNTFYIELNTNTHKIAISYEKNRNKKKFFINNKITSKKNFKKYSLTNVNFSPMTMNMIYLQPSLRRDFLDQILSKSFEKYDLLLKNYKKILQNRNKLLKNIRNEKSKIEELSFWDEEFVKIAKIIYEFRYIIINFLKKNINNNTDLNKYFDRKIKKISIEYISKINEDDIEKNIKIYLNKNIEKDIILANTSIWAHLDDFQIYVDDMAIDQFASRGEIKSIIIELKLLEIKFIEYYLKQKPILLIDDLISELDEKHKNFLLKKIQDKQSFISVIKKDSEEIWNFINL